jgi:hypothetical protein
MLMADYFADQDVKVAQHVSDNFCCVLGPFVGWRQQLTLVGVKHIAVKNLRGTNALPIVVNSQRLS